MTTDAKELEHEESRRDTQWDLDFRACVAGILAREVADSAVSSIDLSCDVTIESAAKLADRMRVKRSKRPIGTPEPEIRRRYRSLCDAVKEVQEVIQLRDIQTCPIPIALSRVLDALFVELDEG